MSNGRNGGNGFQDGFEGSALQAIQNSKNRVMNAVAVRIMQVAFTEASVLVLGETGTGKNVVARAIHERSRRNERPLVTINCAALPAELIESELFGYNKGAFTGAQKDTPGKLQMADKGAIFLDEIGELPLASQAKLLRFLQDREFERLGSTQTIQVDVRVLTATNHDLLSDVEEGRFRADLYYRLNVVPITAPPLRERREDIPDLSRGFLKYYETLHRKPITHGFQAAAMEVLIDPRYPWPGNVRELQHLVERAVILHSAGPDNLSLGPEIFKEGMVTRTSKSRNTSIAIQDTSGGGDGSSEGLRQFEAQAADQERGAILKALETTHWNRKQAATLLKVDYKALLYKMKKLHVEEKIPGRPGGSNGATEHTSIVAL